MLPEIVTFWHGPLDALRRLCLRSQVAAGHRVTVYSFDAIPGLPKGVENAEAEAILLHAFSERLRPAEPDGFWSDWTTVQFSDFFRMRLMRSNAGLWLDTDVLLFRPVEIDPARPFFAWERRGRLGNSVLYLPPDHPIVIAFEKLMAQEELKPDWLSLGHRLTFAWHRLRGSKRVTDFRVALFGPAALTALAARFGALQHVQPRKSFDAVHSHPERFFEPSDFSRLICDPDITGLHISLKGRGSQKPVPGSLHAWAAERFGPG